MKKDNTDGGSTCPAADDQGGSSLAVWRQAGGSHCYTDIEEVFHRLVDPEVVNDEAAFREQLHRHFERLPLRSFAGGDSYCHTDIEEVFDRLMEKGIPEVVNDPAAFREQLHRHFDHLVLREECVPRRRPGDVLLSLAHVQRRHHQEEDVQLELNNNKHFGRLKADEAYAYVNRSVDISGDEDFSCMVSEEERERRDAARPTAEKEVKQQAWVVQVEAEIDEDMKAQHEVRSSHRLSKIAEVKLSCRCRRGCQSLKSLIYRVIYSNANTTGHLEWQKKSWPNYTLNTLLFACTMLFSAYMNPSSSTSITIKILLVVDIVVCITINAVLLIKLPNWGNALGCISWLLLEFAMCLLILPFNGYYAFCILTVLFLIVIVALLQPKLQHAVNSYALPSFTANDSDTQNDINDQENEYINHLFDISNGIATCGGLVTGILGYYSYMEGPVTAAGFFFFCTVLLGLYLMMVIAMRAVSPPHAASLAIVLKVLLLLTAITASVSFVRHSSVTM